MEIIDEIKPGLVLKDNQFYFGYAILTKIKEKEKIHLTTLYNKYKKNLKNEEAIGEDYSNLEDVVSRIALDQFIIIEDKKFKKIQKMIKKSGIIQRNEQLNKLTLYNKLSSIYRAEFNYSK